MIEPRFTLSGLAVLLLAWAGPLPGLVPQSFAAHMTLHMSVVGIGIPLLAAGLAPALSGKRLLKSQLALPIAVSLLDLVVVWGWHAPAPHHASRESALVLAVEQASFALVSLLVWVIALAGAGGVVVALLIGVVVSVAFTLWVGCAQGETHDNRWGDPPLNALAV